MSFFLSYLIISFKKGWFLFFQGGMKAVIWTDVFQGVVMLAGLTTIIVVGTVKVGSLSAVFHTAYKGHRLDVE